MFHNATYLKSESVLSMHIPKLELLTGGYSTMLASTILDRDVPPEKKNFALHI